MWRHRKHRTHELAILVTGASSGIGGACALRLARAGHHVIGVSRTGTIAGRAAEQWSMRELRARCLDITDPAAIQKMLESLVIDYGRLDAVVNAAGICVAGPVEDTPIEFLREQLETNLLGAIYLTRASVPHLRMSAPSWLIHISSLAGQIALPYQSLYCASKFGLEGFCESIRYELEPEGIQVRMIRPGSVRTAVTENRRTFISGEKRGERAHRALSFNDKDELNGVAPDAVARVVEQMLRSRHGRHHRSVGHWHECIALPVRPLLPDGWFRRFVAAHYGIQK